MRKSCEMTSPLMDKRGKIRMIERKATYNLWRKILKIEPIKINPLRKLFEKTKEIIKEIRRDF